MITVREKADCAARALRERRFVYPRLVREERMAKEVADREIAIMEAIVEDYRALADEEAAQQKQMRRCGPGYSIAAFARETNIPYRRVEKAVKANEIASVTIGGVTRIPETEKDRVLRAYGIEAEAAEQEVARYEPET
jgi:hypothetical protein